MENNEKLKEVTQEVAMKNTKRKECASKADSENNEKLEKPIQQVAKKGTKKPKEVAVFGNYRNYYGYRKDKELEEDPRLKVLRKEWFEGKDCLDIGCNSGVITIHIAKKFGCRSILGIDIDSQRIEDGYWNLRHTSRQEKELSATVSFQKENFVLNPYPPPEQHYDTILCLSVTKWIHLNWGDAGLITLFTKIWKLLQPGGILVLEPQPWRSYESNHLVSETTRINFHNIRIYPRDFQDLLLDKIGFKTVEDLTSSLSGAKTGFNRPILAFQK